jgi:hypothetical protein
MASASCKAPMRRSRGAETNGLTVLKKPHAICFYDAKLWLASQKVDISDIQKKCSPERLIWSGLCGPS